MGQYFIFVNLDKKEFIKPDSGWKLWEICANASSVGILAYLLADGEVDGTVLIKMARTEERKKQLLEAGWKIINELEFLDKKIWVFTYPTKFFGRWSGDRIVVAGDYGPTGLYEKAMKEFKDITEEAYEEFHKLIQIPSSNLIRPDIIIK